MKIANCGNDGIQPIRPVLCSRLFLAQPTRNYLIRKPPPWVPDTMPPIMSTTKPQTMYIDREILTPLPTWTPPPRAIARRWQCLPPQTVPLPAPMLINSKVVTALQDVARLTGTIAELRRNLGNPNTVTALKVGWAKRHYCWTCGYACEHYSRDFPRPATGHQKGATRANRLGGSTKNKPS